MSSSLPFDTMRKPLSALEALHADANGAHARQVDLGPVLHDWVAVARQSMGSY